MKQPARRFIVSIFAALGVVFSGILAFDIVGYRLLGEDRFCSVKVTPADSEIGDWTLRIDVPDGGSGCDGPTAVCRGTRLLLPDPSRSC